MKKSRIFGFALVAVMAASIAAPRAQALIYDPKGQARDCRGGMDNAMICALSWIISIPTMVVGADATAMDEAQRKALVMGEARNYLQAVPGDYLLLKLTARSMGKGTSAASLEKVASSIVKSAN